MTVVVLAYAAYLLGEWQFHRLTERKVTNAITRTNLGAAPVPVERVLAPGRPSGPRNEWRRVSATGTYRAEESVVIRYQTRDGASGVDVVTPLTTDTGASLLVDRGWLSTGNRGADRVDAPAPPSGRVTVLGWVRADATGDAATVTDRSARAISSVQIGRALGTPVYGGFVDLQRESPAPGTALVPTEMPELDNGPHFFYGLQWFFFGLLAVFGFCYLAYDERKKLVAARSGSRASGAPGPPPDGPADQDGQPARTANWVA